MLKLACGTIAFDDVCSSVCYAYTASLDVESEFNARIILKTHLYTIVIFGRIACAKIFGQKYVWTNFVIQSFQTNYFFYCLAKPGVRTHARLYRRLRNLIIRIHSKIIAWWYVCFRSVHHDCQHHVFLLHRRHHPASVTISSFAILY